MQGIPNVRDVQFASGAVGDGVHDDTAAIIAASNAGTAVWFPPPPVAYTLSDTFVWPTNKPLHWIGAGSAAVHIRALAGLADNPSMVRREPGYFFGGGIKGITLDADKKCPRNLEVLGGYQMVFEDMGLHNATVANLRLKSPNHQFRSLHIRTREGAAENRFQNRADMPEYNVLCEAGATDLQFSQVNAYGAKYANFHDGCVGSNNSFQQCHGYALPNYQTYAPLDAFAADYNFWLGGTQQLINSYGDGSNVAAIYCLWGGSTIVGNTAQYIHGKGILIGSGAAVDLTVTGNNMRTAAPANKIVLMGAPGANCTIRCNAGATVEV